MPSPYNPASSASSASSASLSPRPRLASDRDPSHPPRRFVAASVSATVSSAARRSFSMTPPSPGGRGGETSAYRGATRPTRGLAASAAAGPRRARRRGAPRRAGRAGADASGPTSVGRVRGFEHSGTRTRAPPSARAPVWPPRPPGSSSRRLVPPPRSGRVRQRVPRRRPRHPGVRFGTATPSPRGHLPAIDRPRAGRASEETAAPIPSRHRLGTPAASGRRPLRRPASRPARVRRLDRQRRDEPERGDDAVGAVRDGSATSAPRGSAPTRVARGFGGGGCFRSRASPSLPSREQGDERAAAAHAATRTSGSGARPEGTHADSVERGVGVVGGRRSRGAAAPGVGSAAVARRRPRARAAAGASRLARLPAARGREPAGPRAPRAPRRRPGPREAEGRLGGRLRPRLGGRSNHRFAREPPRQAPPPRPRARRRACGPRGALLLGLVRGEGARRPSSVSSANGVAWRPRRCAVIVRVAPAPGRASTAPERGRGAERRFPDAPPQRGVEPREVLSDSSRSPPLASLLRGLGSAGVAPGGRARASTPTAGVGAGRARASPPTMRDAAAPETDRSVATDRAEREDERSSAEDPPSTLSPRTRAPRALRPPPRKKSARVPSFVPAPEVVPPPAAATRGGVAEAPPSRERRGGAGVDERPRRLVRPRRKRMDGDPPPRPAAAVVVVAAAAAAQTRAPAERRAEPVVAGAPLRSPRRFARRRQPPTPPGRP